MIRGIIREGRFNWLHLEDGKMSLEQLLPFLHGYPKEYIIKDLKYKEPIRGYTAPMSRYWIIAFRKKTKKFEVRIFDIEIDGMLGPRMSPYGKWKTLPPVEVFDNIDDAKQFLKKLK